MPLLRKLISGVIQILFSTELHVILIYRVSRWLCLRIPMGRGIITQGGRHLMRVYAGCDISPRAVIGKRLRMPHPLCIVIGDGVIIGDDVKIWQCTTIGSHGRKNKTSSYPEIGSRVRIYKGASLIGGIVVGDDAIIGAHSLVTIDVPPAQTAIGCPARIVAERHVEVE